MVAETCSGVGAGGVRTGVVFCWYVLRVAAMVVGGGCVREWRGSARRSRTRTSSLCMMLYGSLPHGAAATAAAVAAVVTYIRQTLGSLHGMYDEHVVAEYEC